MTKSVMKRVSTKPGPWKLSGVLALMVGFIALAGLIGGAAAQPKPVVDSTLAGYVGVAGVSGLLTIAGSDTMQPLVIRLASEFRRQYPEVKISVAGGGSTTAITEFLQTVAKSRRGDGGQVGLESSGEVLLLASSRELTPTEVKEFVMKHGYEPLAMPVAVDAVAIYVHRTNPLTGLTLEQLDAVYSSTRKRGYHQKIETWGQLGLTNGWEKARIQLYGRDQKSGTREFLKEHVLNHGAFDSYVKEVPGAASMILAVSRDPYGIGYSGIGFQTSSVRAVPLGEKDGAPYVTPNFESAMDGTYPLRRFLFLYVNKPPQSTLQPVVQEFLKLANSREGQMAVIKTGFYPIPAKQVAQNLAAVTASPTN